MTKRMRGITTLAAGTVAAVAVATAVAVPPPASYTTNGASPRAFPSTACGGFLGICLSSPIERARQLFGLETSRGAIAGQKMDSSWTLRKPNASVTAFSDRVGAIYFLLLSTRGAGVRIALPGHVVLGASTMGTVLSKLGQPAKKDKLQGENQIVYSYVYFVGGEGSIKLSYSYSAIYASPGDPRGFNAALNAKRVDQFSACFATDPDC